MGVLTRIKSRLKRGEPAAHRQHDVARYGFDGGGLADQRPGDDPENIGGMGEEKHNLVYEKREID